MNLESTAGDRIPFNDPETIFGGFSIYDVIRLAYCAGDFTLAIDGHGVIRDIAVSVRDHGFANQWIGQKWADTVTVESKPKIDQLLDRSHGTKNIWRQVNHVHDGEDFPVTYQLIRPDEDTWSIAAIDGTRLPPFAPDRDALSAVV
jgi:hypothetical protein